MERIAPAAHEDLVAKVAAYNNILANEDSTRRELTEALDAVDIATDAAKVAYKVDAYNEALEQGDPMGFIVDKYTYPSVVVRVEKDKETKMEVARYVEDTDVPYDMLALQSFYAKTQTDRTKTVFSDPKAPHILQRVNEMLTLRIASRVQGKALVREVEKKYRIGAKAAELMLDRKVPTAEKDVRALVQELADAFWKGLAISEQRANALIETYVAPSQGISVKCPPHARLAALLLKSMHAEKVNRNFALICPVKKEG